MKLRAICPSKMASFWLASLVAILLHCPQSHAGPPFPEFIDPNPNPWNYFGLTVLPLSTGNVVVTSPGDDAGGEDAGAVYLFNGATGALISTLRGSHSGDSVGAKVVAVGNGHFVVLSPEWDNGTATNAGAVTWGNGNTGVSGTVSSGNSLVGSKANDNVGSFQYKLGGVTYYMDAIQVLTNGNYLVVSPGWDSGAVEDAGAVTWGSAVAGVKGVISSANSLVGSSLKDCVGLNADVDNNDLSSSHSGNAVTLLPNGNYVVSSPCWNDAAGAITWGSGTAGVKGAVSSGNSLVGSNPGDKAGLSGVLLTPLFIPTRQFQNGVTVLKNGNYVVASSFWNSGRGAVTFCPGGSAITGTLSSSNSLVGATMDDFAGSGGVSALSNGNYVVESPFWDNAGIIDAGAATWGSGTTGVKGTISVSNSLVGSREGDKVSRRGVTGLSNGNYVVISDEWNNGAVANAGAVTWGSGATGMKGTVNSGNSLVGTTALDEVGTYGVIALSNGNYVVSSPLWDNAGVVNAGAVTWGSGTSGVKGAVSSANSLVGSAAEDQVGYSGTWYPYGGVTALSNGNYVVASKLWDNATATDAGAVTWGNGTSGTMGAVTASNSLVGSTTNDYVGGDDFGVPVIGLKNGNFVVRSPNWNNGATVRAGAVTWGSGTTGAAGIISSGNSLVGTAMNDRVGGGIFDWRTPYVTELTNGNFVVTSPDWHMRGAATWCSGTAGLTGAISSENSLVGESGDGVGCGGVTALTNGNYVVSSPLWSGMGAATWGDGAQGIVGSVNGGNSLVGTSNSDQISEPFSRTREQNGILALKNGSYLVVSYYWSNTGNPRAGAVSWGNGLGGSSGPVGSGNSLTGLTSYSGLYEVVLDDYNNTFLGPFPEDNGGRVRVGSQETGLSPSPGITVSQAGVLNDGTSSVSFSTAGTGSAGTPLIFTISNPGSADLTDLVVTKDGVNADDFTVGELSATSIPAGSGPVTFTVTFAPTQAGTRTAVLHIASNVIGPRNPFDITVTGSGVSTDATLSALSLSSGQLSPAFAAETTGYTASVANAVASVTVSAVKAEPNASVQVRVNGGSYMAPARLLNLVIGLNTIEVRVTAQDATTNKTYSIAVTRADGPEIVIRGNNVEIPDAQGTPGTNNNTFFGTMSVASGTRTHTFSIANEGGLALSLTGSPMVSISGPHAADFQVTAMPGSAIVASGSSTAFEITFDPSVTGLRTAVVSIGNDDADEAHYTFAIAGNGRQAAQAAQVIAFTPPPKLYLDESPVTLGASASSGLPVIFTVVSGPGSVSGNTLTVTKAGTMTVRASQPGNGDFFAASTVERSITVSANPTSVTLANLSQTYTGTPRPVSVLGTAENVEVTYKIGTTYVTSAPSDVGSYPVKVVAGSTTKASTLVITPAPLFVTAQDQRRLVGQPNPALRFDYRGFVAGDDAANSVSKAPAISTTATVSSAGGLYPISTSGGVVVNYLCIHQKGVMQVDSFAGSYEALLRGDDTSPAAKLELTVTAGCKTFTGKLTTPTETAPVGFKGTLSAPSADESLSGSAEVTKGTNTYVLTMTLPLKGDFSVLAKRNLTMLGSTNTGRKLLTLAAGQTLGYSGTHSTLLAPPAPAAGVPAGTGWATSVIDGKGLLKLAGKLGDGTSWTAAAAADIGSNPGYRMFVQPYTPARTGSFIAGDFTLKVHPDLPGRRIVGYEDSANLVWVKALRQADSSYRGGFGPVSTRLTLDPWLPPVTAKGSKSAVSLAQRLGLTSNQLDARHSSMASASFGNLPTRLALSAKNALSVIAPLTTPVNITKWKVTLVPSTGAFKGSFELSDSGKRRPVPFTGILRQPPSTDTSGLIGDGSFQVPPLNPAVDSQILSGEVGFVR